MYKETYLDKRGTGLRAFLPTMAPLNELPKRLRRSDGLLSTLRFLLWRLIGAGSSPADILLPLSLVGVKAVGESLESRVPVSLSDAALRDADSAERPQSFRRLAFSPN